jgi:hypothetical protein
MEIAAFLHRTDTELLLKSRRVVPARLLGAGFEFEFPSWPAAARDLVARIHPASRRASSQRIGSQGGLSLRGAPPG